MLMKSLVGVFAVFLLAIVGLNLVSSLEPVEETFGDAVKTEDGTYRIRYYQPASEDEIWGGRLEVSDDASFWRNRGIMTEEEWIVYLGEQVCLLVDTQVFSCPAAQIQQAYMVVLGADFEKIDGFFLVSETASVDESSWYASVSTSPLRVDSRVRQMVLESAVVYWTEETGIELLIHAQGRLHSLRISPDGNWLVFVRDDYVFQEVYMVSLSEPTRLLTMVDRQEQMVAYYDQLVWSSDSEYLALVSHSLGLSDVCVVAVKGDQSCELIELGFLEIIGLSWSPRGDWLSFYAKAKGDKEMHAYILSLDGGTLRDRGVSSDPSWVEID